MKEYKLCYHVVGVKPSQRETDVLQTSLCTCPFRQVETHGTSQYKNVLPDHCQVVNWGAGVTQDQPHSLFIHTRPLSHCEAANYFSFILLSSPLALAASKRRRELCPPQHWGRRPGAAFGRRPRPSVKKGRK